MLKISVSIYHFPTPNSFCVGTWQYSSVTKTLAAQVCALSVTVAGPLDGKTSPKEQVKPFGLSFLLGLVAPLLVSTSLVPFGMAGTSSAPGLAVHIPPSPVQPGTACRPCLGTWFAVPQYWAPPGCCCLQLSLARSSCQAGDAGAVGVMKSLLQQCR